jgi:hypothetical protein
LELLDVIVFDLLEAPSQIEGSIRLIVDIIIVAGLCWSSLVFVGLRWSSLVFVGRCCCIERGWVMAEKKKVFDIFSCDV